MSLHSDALSPEASAQTPRLSLPRRSQRARGPQYIVLDLLTQVVLQLSVRTTTNAMSFVETTRIVLVSWTLGVDSRSLLSEILTQGRRRTAHATRHSPVIYTGHSQGSQPYSANTHFQYSAFNLQSGQGRFVTVVIYHIWGGGSGRGTTCMPFEQSASPLSL